MFPWANLIRPYFSKYLQCFYKSRSYSDEKPYFLLGSDMINKFLTINAPAGFDTDNKLKIPYAKSECYMHKINNTENGELKSHYEILILDRGLNFDKLHTLRFSEITYYFFTHENEGLNIQKEDENIYICDSVLNLICFSKKEEGDKFIEKLDFHDYSGFYLENENERYVYLRDSIVLKVENGNNKQKTLPIESYKIGIGHIYINLFT
jgi:hypothetical protein